ncbi:pimeloyl-ACP methyl ester carboxylesterase [Paenibacillus sp. DS2015]|uniref:alpha/beta fold hydrolase n=1 Tax=Paenibacillus sp. DS2015 TaxID=3373917 RepID=UPI003D194A73
MTLSNICEINGAKLHVSNQGQGDTVLLLHGGYSNLTIWDEHVEDISQQYHVIRYDQRGYGHSSEPTSPFSYYEDIKGVLDYYGVSNTHIVASSFGGAAAIDFTLAYPQYVNKLILVAPSIHGMKYPFRMRWEGIGDYLRVQRIGIEKAVDILLNRKFWSYMIPKAADRQQLFREMYINNSGFYNSKPSLQQPLSPYAIHRLKEIIKPMLIIDAENDHPFNKKACKILQEEVQSASQVTIQNSGHYPHLEHPFEFTSILLKYLK